MNTPSSLSPAPSDRLQRSVRIVADDEISWFDDLLGQHHYLGAGQPVGDYLRQVVEQDGQPVALLVWGPACYALKDRDRWISWSANQCVERLILVVQNRRFLLLTGKGQSPNLASQVLSAALRVLPEQWQQRFGYRPLLAKTFTDPEAYAGTCYKASNWEPVGFSAGYRRHRADFYVANERPKKLWLYPLRPDARPLLRAAQVPEACRAGLGRAPDPRDPNTHYRIGPVLPRIALALLAGRREIAEIVRFANTLKPAQRRRLGLPIKKGTRRFYQVPAYGVFYQVLTRMDPASCATCKPSDWVLCGWIRIRPAR